MPVDFLEIIVAIMACIGVGIVALHRVEGFWVLCFGQMLAIVYFSILSQFWIAGQMFVLTIFNGYGIYNWKKNGVGKEPIKWPWIKGEN